MSTPHEHTKKSLMKDQVRKGGASKNVSASLAIASEAEMAAKAPIGEVIGNNFIKNALYDADARYPGAGGRTEAFAGFSLLTNYPIELSTNPSGDQEIIMTLWNDAAQTPDSYRFRFTFHNASGSNVVKDVVVDGSGNYGPDGALSITTAITGADVSASGIGTTTAQFNSVTFQLLHATNDNEFAFTGYPYGQAVLVYLEIRGNGSAHFPNDGGGYGVFGGALMNTSTYGDGEILLLSQRKEYGSPYSHEGHTPVKASANGIGAYWKGNRMPIHWQHYCPLYTQDSTNNYETYYDKRFYRVRKTKDTYVDIAEKFDPSTVGTIGTSKTSGHIVGPIQARAIELRGSEYRPTDRENDFDRSYPDIPIWGLIRGDYLPGSTSWSAQAGAVRPGRWVKHAVHQTVEIPTGAVSLKYGAYVQCPGAAHGNDIPMPTQLPGQTYTAPYTAFKDTNFGAIQISQDYGEGEGAVPSSTNERFVRGDCMHFLNEATQATNYKPPINITSGVIAHTQYNWNGLSSVYSLETSGGQPITTSEISANMNNEIPVHPHGFCYPTDISVDGGTFNDYDFPEFKLVERTWSGWDSSTDLDSSHAHYTTHLKQINYLKLELIFYENQANLEDIGPPLASGSLVSTLGSSGAIRFYSPFVQFFDANGDIISPS